jgi:hypothetical protein
MRYQEIDRDFPTYYIHVSQLSRKHNLNASSSVLLVFMRGLVNDNVREPQKEFEHTIVMTAVATFGPRSVKRTMLKCTFDRYAR